MSSEITIVGNLGADAELSFMPNGDPVTTFSICSNEYGRSGETQNWYNVNLFGSSETFHQHLTKGTGLYFKGRLKAKPWTGRDGTPRVNLKVNTNRVEFTGGKRSANPPAAPPEVTEAPSGDLSENDIPF